MRKNTPVLSLVIPVFNEEAGIPALFAALNALKPKFPSKTEVILVDDGSRDGTFRALQQRRLNYKKVLIQFSRNFGHQAALLAGMERAKGQFIVTMDGDLQHPPELIPKMVAMHRKGVDIVLTKRIDLNYVSAFKKATAFLFYVLINLLSDTYFAFNVSDYRSLNRRAVNSLLALPERRKFIRGMVQWIGYSNVTLPFKVKPRAQGKSKYSLGKMVRLALFGLSSFSTAPLYFSVFFSIVMFVLAVIYALYVLYIRFIVGSAISGWASLLFVTLVIGGFLSLFLGLIGIYIAAIYDEVKRRPLYVIKKTLT